METIYIVQGFVAGKRGELTPMQPIAFKTEAEARSRAARLGLTCDGVIAFAQAADIDAGEYSDPIMIDLIGTVPKLS
ncbi:hypothetical protein [Luteibacter sp.]|uniref:hypothetical protein n=1 Tax=Luteibacter sp. TaxID=1886636 RepID=UPI0025C486B4|nr:hypothetical protein [Luteibacter sp.]